MYRTLHGREDMVARRFEYYIFLSGETKSYERVQQLSKILF